MEAGPRLVDRGRRLGLDAVTVNGFGLALDERCRRHLVIVIQLYEAHALSGAPDGAYVGGSHPDKLAVRRHDQDIGVFIDAHDGHDLTVFVGRANIDDSLTAASLHAILSHDRSLSESAFSHRQDHLFFGGAGNHRDDEISLVESYSDDAVRLAAHLTNVGMIKTNT